MDILKVKNLKTYFFIKDKELPAVDGVSFNLKDNEILAIIGESGSGKSILSLSILKLIDKPGKIINGEILFLNKKSLYKNNIEKLSDKKLIYEDILLKNEKEMLKIRGKEIAMIYQDPMSSLNPYLSVGSQLAEGLIIHNNMNKRDAREESLNLMKSVGINMANERYNNLPRTFSGGMRQRIMIAMAISCKPKILLADEPTTALDVTIQKDILNLLYTLRKERNMSIILNTHDLGVVKEIADNVLVMYCGIIMEKSTVKNLFLNPLNPYTQGLIKSMPKVYAEKKRLYNIKGSVPDPDNFPKGCRFSNRCPYVFKKCKEKVPELIEIKENHFVRCFLYEKN